MTLRFPSLREFEEWRRGKAYGPVPKKSVRQVHLPGRMNKTEAAWAQRLEARKHAGEIVDFKFEALKFRLAKRTWYTPDFMVVLPDRSIELHEVKGGFIREDGLLKFKLARELFPWFRWRMVQRRKTKWETLLD